MKTKNLQSGFTITELLITIALSMSVISSVLVGYMATYTSSMNTLAASKMNQDMNAVMNLMISELRRAGYDGSIAASGNPAENAFSDINNTALEVFDNMTDNNQVAATGNGSCIVYAYDMDEDGVVDANELGGFRLNNGEVQLRTSGNVADPDTCASASNTWDSLTDGDFITVTNLNFNLVNSQCLNTREPDGINNDPGEDATIDEADEADCYDTATNTGDVTVETRQVLITLTGNLTGDTFVQVSHSQDVRVRNDMVRIR